MKSNQENDHEYNCFEHGHEPVNLFVSVETFVDEDGCEHTVEPIMFNHVACRHCGESLRD